MDMREIKRCKACGKEFITYQHGDFCSVQCYRNYKLECPICHCFKNSSSIEKHIWGCKLKKGLVEEKDLPKPYRFDGKASSKEKEALRRQRISETMKKNPKAGGLRKGSGRGKKCWYESPIAGRVYLRSTYELEYCKYLDSHKIPWKQNTEGFEYQFEGKTHKYFPDFIILTEQPLYIEIKGFKRKNDEAKWKSFPHRLEILYYNDLQKLGILVEGNYTEHRD